MPYTNNKGAGQPAYPRSLISAFVVCCLDSIIPLVSSSEISSLCLASVAAQDGLCFTWSQTSKTGFLVTRLRFQIMLYICKANSLISCKDTFLMDRLFIVFMMACIFTPSVFIKLEVYSKKKGLKETDCCNYPNAI